MCDQYCQVLRKSLGGFVQLGVAGRCEEVPLSGELRLNVITVNVLLQDWRLLLSLHQIFRLFLYHRFNVKTGQ